MNTVTSDTPPPVSGFLGELLIRAWRTITVLLMVGLAIITGIALPVMLQGYIATLKPAGLAFGAATVLAVLKNMLETLPKAVDYIVGAVTNYLPKLFAEIAIAALGVGFAWYAAIDTSSANEHPISLNVGGTLPPLVLSEGGAAFVTYLTFADKESSLPPADPQLQLVSNLVQTLGECVQSDKDKIDVLVRGYASSRGTDTENRDLYQKRTEYAAGVLKASIDTLPPAVAAHFSVEQRKWPTLEVMKIRRLFKDTDANNTCLDKAAALNRRADIIVRSAGSCLPL
jgi:hypothetical protein